MSRARLEKAKTMHQAARMQLERAEEELALAQEFYNKHTLPLEEMQNVFKSFLKEIKQAQKDIWKEVKT